MTCCNAHPINISDTLLKLRQDVAADDKIVNAWIAHWNAAILAVFEAPIEAAPICFGAQRTLAEVALTSQLFNARRFFEPLEAFRKLLAIDAALLNRPSNAPAHPTVQADAE